MTTWQIVFLLDFNVLCKDSCVDPDVNSIQLKHLRRVILKFLTYFSNQCASAGATSECFNLKWDCRYYDSSGKKPLRQRCTFRDFTLRAYQKFEDELEEKFNSKRYEVKNSNQIGNRLQWCCDEIQPTHLVQPPGIKSNVSKTFSHPLELTLKEVLCDYSWDSPCITSPVRITRSTKTQKTPGNFKEADTNTTENVIIIITSLAKLLEDLKTFAGKTWNKLTSLDILKSTFTPALQKQIFHVNKIRLLWLDVSSNYCPPLNEVHLTQNTAHIKFIDQELGKFGGGIIPLNSVLPCFSNNSCSDNVPETLEIRLPFASVLSGYCQNGKRAIRHWKSCYSSLKINPENNLVYHLELLPLFRQIKNTHCNYLRKSSNNSLNQSTSAAVVTNIHNSNHSPTASTNFQQFPKNLSPIGTLHLNDIHKLLINKPLVYICCATNNKRTSENHENEVKFHHLLTELAEQQLALLLSCDDLCQGILYPASGKCQVAVLYILACKKILSVIGEGTPLSAVPPETKDFIGKLLKNWRPCLNHDNLRKTSDLISDESRLPNEYFEKWFDPSVNLTARDDAVLLRNCNNSFLEKQSNIFASLQKAYVSSLLRSKEHSGESSTIGVSGVKKYNQNSKKSSSLPNELESHSQQSSDSCCNSDISSHSVILKNFASSHFQKSDGDEPKSEVELVDVMKNVYEMTIQGETDLLTGAQRITDLCLTFCSNDCSSDFLITVKNIMTQNLLLQPSDVIRKYSNITESNKKVHTREHCLQAVLRLELLLKGDSNEPETSISDIVSHLRRLSFIDGPALSTFLQDTIVEKYQFSLNDIVMQICDDLDQPFCRIAKCDSSSSSETDSPEKACSSIPNFISEASELSSSSIWSSPGKANASKRNSRIVKHPSFTNFSRHRQIAISKKQNIKCQSKNIRSKSMITRSADKRKLNAYRDGASKKCRSTRKHYPTTPQGRHVLKTTKVAETPVHKQVDRPLLAKLALKRKYTSDSNDDENVVIEESPDKMPSPTLRRSPRLNPNSSSKSNKKLQIGAPFSSQKSSQKKTRHGDPASIIDRKVRVCRKLNLDGSSPVLSNKMTSVPQRRSPRFKQPSTDLDNNFERISSRNRNNNNSEDKRARTRLKRFYSLNSESRHNSVSDAPSDTNNSSNEDTPSSKTPHRLDETENCNLLGNAVPTRTPKKLAVSRKILQTPSKSCDVAKESNSNDFLLSDDVNLIVESTPVRRGQESPVARSGILCGSLSDCLDYCLSPSSSPTIPLYYQDGNYTSDICQDENQFNIEQSRKDLDWTPNSDWLPCTPLESSDETCDLISVYGAESVDVRYKECFSNNSCLPIISHHLHTSESQSQQCISHLGSESKGHIIQQSEKVQKLVHPSTSSLFHLTTSPIVTSLAKTSRKIR